MTIGNSFVACDNDEATWSSIKVRILWGLSKKITICNSFVAACDSDEAQWNEFKVRIESLQILDLPITQSHCWTNHIQRITILSKLQVPIDDSTLKKSLKQNVWFGHITGLCDLYVIKPQSLDHVKLDDKYQLLNVLRLMDFKLSKLGDREIIANLTLIRDNQVENNWNQL
eukprot:Awhi_evm1s2635